MKKNKILPFVYPEITSWQWHANLFALLGMSEEAKGWIYNNYIQMYCASEYKQDPKILHIDFFPYYNSFVVCPLLHTQYVDRKFILKKFSSVKEFLCFCIDENYYVYGICNEKFLLNRKENFIHDLFVYGYNLEKHTFNVADFTLKKGGKYTQIETSIDDVCQGFSSIDEKEDHLLRGEGGFLLMKRQNHPEISYVFDINLVKRNLKEYLEGYNSFEHMYLECNSWVMNYRETGEPCPYLAYGINIYQMLIRYIKTESPSGEIPPKIFHILYDHKKLMKNRVKYMVEHFFLRDESRIMEMLNEIERISIIIRNLVLKANLTIYTSDIVNRICQKLSEVECMEFQCYNEILQKI